MHVLGLDIGGANLKATHTIGRTCVKPFALWKAPERLVEELRAILEESHPFDRVAVTMTGELCDCFESKRAGILHILEAVESASLGKPIVVWTNEGQFVSLAEARRRPLPAASANWLALASVLARLVPIGPALLFDIGTTTTDIIPLMNGQPIPTGRTDSERFTSRELVYIGWRRTPLCAFTGTSRAAELYATTADAFLVLDLIDENRHDTDTADGRPLTRAAANRRLARMLGGDLETTSPRQCEELANEIVGKVVGRIALAANEVMKRLPAPPVALLSTGSGEFLVPQILRSTQCKPQLNDCSIVSSKLVFGDSNYSAGCARAVAMLCREQFGP